MTTEPEALEAQAQATPPTVVLARTRIVRLWAVLSKEPALASAGLALILAGCFWAVDVMAMPAAAPMVATLPTPSLAVPMPTERPATGPTLPAATVAYDAPDGAPLGALEANRPFTPLARFGADWLLIDAGSGPVWVQVHAVGIPAGAALADLKPTDQPVVIIVERAAPPVAVAPLPLPAAAPIAPPVPAQPAQAALQPMAPASYGDAPKPSTKPDAVMPVDTGTMPKPSTK